MDKQFNTDDLTKMYYTIGEVAEMFNVNTSLIRFWEKEFKQIKPKKNNKGNRLFTPKDIKIIQTIYHLVKQEGFTLDGAKKALSAPVISESKASDEASLTLDTNVLIQKMENIKQRLLRLKN